MDMERPKVFIVILNWNGLSDTIECLESLRKVSYPNYKVMVVDNASTGDDVKVLRERYGDYVHIVKNKKNYGYVEGNKIGIKFSLEKGADYVLLLNNDTVVDPKFINGLIEAFEDERSIGIASPMIYYYYQPNKIDYGGEGVHCFGFKSSKAWEDQTNEELIDVVWVHGACMLMKREKIEQMGILSSSPGLFMYGDTFWSLTALKEGLRIVYVPWARIWHKVSRASRRQGLSRLRWEVKDNVILRYHFLRSGYHKHLTPTQFANYATWLFIYRPFTLIGYALSALIITVVRGLFRALGGWIGYIKKSK